MQVTSLDQFDAAAQALSLTRGNLVLGAKTASSLIKDYADALCAMFDVRDDQGMRVKPWYELKGKAKTGVKAERAVFAAAMQEGGFGTGTTDVYWQRVKEASGYVTAGNRVRAGQCQRLHECLYDGGTAAAVIAAATARKNQSEDQTRNDFCRFAYQCERHQMPNRLRCEWASVGHALQSVPLVSSVRGQRLATPHRCEASGVSGLQDVGHVRQIPSVSMRSRAQRSPA